MAKALLRIAVIIAVVFSILGIFLALIYAGSIFFVYPDEFGSAFSVIFDKIQSIIPILSIVVLSITFGAIAYYSIEAMRLRKITSDRLSYNTRPVIILKLKEDEKKDYEPIIKEKRTQLPINGLAAEIKNIGEGIATNIDVEKIVATDSEGKEIFIVTGEIMPLARAEKEEVGFYVICEHQFEAEYVKQKIFNGEFRNDGMIKIYYDDLQGNKFYTLMKQKEKGGEWNFYKTSRRSE